MKLSRNWIADYVDFDDLSIEEFEDLITTRVAEVEGVYTSASPLAQAQVGKILSRKKHPEKDRLSIVEVELGCDTRTLICGAPNCDADSFVAYIPVGGEIVSAKDSSPMKIEAREVAGVMSAGVLASEFELGISSQNNGIFILEDESAKSGELLSRYLGAPDTIIEIDNKSLTHRPDLWSHFGFAREISAILKRPLKHNPDRFADCDKRAKDLLEVLSKGQGGSRFSIKVEDSVACRRFLALELDNLSTATSPLWMRRRLHSVGAGVRNLLVDLSNYVMHDIGQPNHLYDAERLSGKTISVRRAVNAEKLCALDGKTYALCEKDLVVSDESGPIALAGVIGGAESSVAEGTKRVLLESANFAPSAVRLMTKRHAIRTDSSNRFEKDQSPYAVPLAVQRFCELLLQIDPKARISSAVIDSFVEPPAELSFELNFDYIRDRLGTALSDEAIAEILVALSFRIEKAAGAKSIIHVPYFRATRDVSMIDDLVEEIGRIHGYENIPEAIPEISSVATPVDPLRKLSFAIRDALVAMGFSECDTYSFMDDVRARELLYLEPAIELENAIDSNLRHLRTTLIPAMLANLEVNAKHSENFALFEIARTYHKQEPSTHAALKLKKRYPNQACFERNALVLAYVSGKDEATLAQTNSAALAQGGDFYALLSVMRKLVRSVSKREIEVRAIEKGSELYRSWMHPYRAASVCVEGSPCFAIIAELAPRVVDGLSSRAVLAELDLNLLLELDGAPLLYQPIAKFPASFFEMSVVMPEHEPFYKLKALIEGSVEPELLKNIEVLSVYSGKPLADGEKSVSVRLFLQAEQATLSAEQLQSVQARLMMSVSNVYALRA